LKIIVDNIGQYHMTIIVLSTLKLDMILPIYQNRAYLKPCLVIIALKHMH